MSERVGGMVHRETWEKEFSLPRMGYTGMDGWIRVWFYETIDQAYSQDGDNFLEIQPIYEYHVGESDEVNSMLMCIRKQEPDNLESTLWYAQVSNEFPPY